MKGSVVDKAFRKAGGLEPGVVAIGLTLVAMAVAAGCGQRDRFNVVGTVTFAGKPVPAGTVTFLPVGSVPPGRVAGSCSIRSGKYATRNGRSPGSGPHRAVVDGYDGMAFQSRMGEATVDHPLGKPLFPSHMVEVDLPAKDGTVLDIEVPGP